jgi:gluconolactonase
MPTNPIDHFTLGKNDFRFIGEDLQRPECILAEKDGTLWSADARGGVVRIDPDGTQSVITQSHAGGFGTGENESQKFVAGTLPNGLAFADNGDIWISNFGTDCLERMRRTGETEVIVDTLDGEPIGKVNFIARDTHNRIWITVSTMIPEWPQAICKNVIDGRVLLYEQDKGVRAVADDLHFTNECKLDLREEYLYVVQTCGRNVVRFRIKPDGELSDREVFGPLDHGRFIDGIAFDSHGNLWGTYIMNDGIFAITPEGERKMIFDDSTPDEVTRISDGFQTGEPLDIEMLLECGGTIAPWCASVTFGGADLKTVYVGSLRGTTIPYFTAPVAGLPMVHWDAVF